MNRVQPKNSPAVERLKKSDSVRFFDIDESFFYRIRANTPISGLTPRIDTTNSSRGTSPITSNSPIEDTRFSMGNK